MLIGFRNGMTAAGKRLPYDAEVEYLESTGTQWINLGIIGTSVGKLEVRLKKTDVNGTRRFILNSARNPQPVGLSVYFDVNVNGYFGHNDNGYQCIVGQWYDIEIERGIGYYFDGTLRISTSNIYPFHSENNLLLFQVDSNNKFIGQVASLKIWDSNGVLVRDFIPVRKGAVGYLYDRVSGALFGNAGTGAFVLGPDVVPVEYIESHGTEYIDTGVIATNSHGFRVDVATSQKSGATNARVFGVHEGNTRCGFALYGTTEPSGNDFFWGWNAATGFMADIPQRFVVSLNYKNNRAAIFDGTTNLSSLGTLGNTTKSIYLLNANYNGAPFVGQYAVGRLYKAEISIGSDISNNFLPVRVGTGSTWEGAMMDTLTRRIYRNAGTGAFSYGADLPLDTLA